MGGWVATIFAATVTLAHAEMDAGERAFQKCYSCHDVDPNTKNLQGPNLANIVDRKAAQVADYEYSPAMRAAAAKGLIWDRATLDKYLIAPLDFVPGTTMNFVGIKDAAERAAILDYLARKR